MIETGKREGRERGMDGGGEREERGETHTEREKGEINPFIQSPIHSLI
jgi:hypothetical protein